MAQDLTSILHQVALIQLGIAPPFGLVGIQEATDEPPEAITIFPCFVNEEQETEVLHEAAFGATTPQNYEHRLFLHLAMASALPKYSVRARRAWLKPVLDAFRTNPSLGGTCVGSNVEKVDYRPVEINGSHYYGATFVLHVNVQS